MILILILIVFSFSGNAPTTKNSKTFTKELTDLKDYFFIPDISVMIEKEGKVIYENYFGYADVKKKAKVDSHTVFAVVSITKVFSATLLLQLVEYKKLSLMIL